MDKVEKGKKKNAKIDLLQLLWPRFTTSNRVDINSPPLPINGCQTFSKSWNAKVNEDVTVNT